MEPPRVGPYRPDAFRSSARSTRTAAWLGIVLGVTFTVCFLTGLLSHLIQYPPSWFDWPARPAGLYRVTQGIHVAAGIASIPLLLAKLWAVYPRLWSYPPVASTVHLIERVSLVPLVGGSLFLLVTGLASINRWAPWSFSFPSAHYAAAWIAIGGLVVHFGAKIGATRLAISSERADPVRGPRDLASPLSSSTTTTTTHSLSRRGFLAAIAGATSLLTVATVGQTFGPLSKLSVLAPRDPTVGPQGLPVNKTARAAGIIEAAMDPAFTLLVTGAVSRELILDLATLRALPQRRATLPIACVDGWSATAAWSGVQVRQLLMAAGIENGAEVRVESLQDQSRPYSSSLLDASQAGDPDTLLALDLDGRPLHLDHGFPVRLIGPNRPGVQQTKWVRRMVVL